MARTLRMTLVALLCAALPVAFAACAAGAEVEPEGTVGDGSSITVKMLDNSFKPNAITVQQGTAVRFTLPNVGKLPHNMHIASARGVYRESPWLSEPALSNPGDTGTLNWDVPAEPGVYKFRCDIHEVEMVGTITVE